MPHHTHTLTGVVATAVAALLYVVAGALAAAAAAAVTTNDVIAAAATTRRSAQPAVVTSWLVMLMNGKRNVIDKQTTSFSQLGRTRLRGTMGESGERARVWWGF